MTRRGTEGWLHHGKRWAGLRFEGDLIFIRHPDIPSCVQGGPALPQLCCLHLRSICLLRCSGHYEVPRVKANHYKVHRATRKVTKSQFSRELCDHRGKRVGSPEGVRASFA